MRPARPARNRRLSGFIPGAAATWIPGTSRERMPPAAGRCRLPPGAMKRAGCERPAAAKPAGGAAAIDAPDQPNTRKRTASSMKSFSGNGASLEPNGICARSFQLAGRSQRAAAASSASGL